MNSNQEPEILITASGRNVIDRSSGFIQASAWALMGFLLLSQDLLAKNAAIIRLGPKILVKNLDEFFIGFFIIVLLLVTLLKRCPSIRLPLLLPVGGIVLLGCISSLWNRVPPSIWTVQMFLTLKGIFLFYLFINTRLNAENVKAATKGIAGLGLALLGLGVIDFYCPEAFRQTLNMVPAQMRAGIPSVQAVCSHPGVFGWFMAFMAAFSFAFSIIYRRPANLLLLFLFTIGVFLSLRRKAVLGLFVALLTGVLISKVSKRTKLITFSLLILGTIVLSFAFWPKLEFLLDDAIFHYWYREEYLGPRLSLYLTGYEIGKDYFPLGAGLGRFGSWMSRVHYSPLYYEYDLSKHLGLSEDDPQFLNDTFWPMIMGEIGFIGTCLMIIFIAGLLMRCFRLHLHFAQSRFEQAFSLGIVLILTEALTESLATPIFAKSPQAYFILGAAGIGMSFFHFATEATIRRGKRTAAY
jgi:hypothetical protein